MSLLLANLNRAHRLRRNLNRAYQLLLSLSLNLALQLRLLHHEVFLSLNLKSVILHLLFNLQSAGQRTTHQITLIQL